MNTGEEEPDAVEARMAKVKHKILVMSGKGGVGKTTVAANLAFALGMRGLDVGLMDADMHGPDVPKILGIEDKRPEVSEEKIFPVLVTPRLKTISIGFLLPSRDSSIIWRGPMKMNALRQFLSEVEWGELDYMVVDLPPGCLTATTEVMRNPSPAPICQVRPGDIVYSFAGGFMESGLKAGIEKRRVLDVIPQGIARVYELRTKTRRIKGTADHPILSLERKKGQSRFYNYTLRWKKLAELQHGDIVVIAKKFLEGKSMRIPEVKETWKTRLTIPEYFGFERVIAVTYAGEEEVYDLRVEENHNFIADGVVVHNTGDEPLSVVQLMKEIDGAIIVTTPQDLALLDSRKAVNFSRVLKVPVIGIIENMSGFVCPHCGKETNIFKYGGGEKAATELGVPFLGRVPFDPKMVEAADSGTPFVLQKESKVKDAFEHIIENVRVFVEGKE